jgi:hypothetical protein
MMAALRTVESEAVPHHEAKLGFAPSGIVLQWRSAQHGNHGHRSFTIRPAAAFPPACTHAAETLDVFASGALRSRVA